MKEEEKPVSLTNAGPILVGHLPRAEEDSSKAYIEIPDNTYQNASMGKCSHQEESMTCECHFNPAKDEISRACGDGSDCINRLTLVECLDGDCRCRSYCQNQRFQRKQYADVHVVQTESKGFGLRAGSDIKQDDFIYEYIGEVVNESNLMKRMHAYGKEGIRHFYFMMLQKDEFIDATKKGGKGRFANHSCNPNCYVSKWFVGKRIRMGIFAKRRILKDEELTFNYNVDRYGHDAQPCYCGELNCVGFIGGKTQTDIAIMDDGYMDALGLDEDEQKQALKALRKKKVKKDDEDFAPTISPVKESQVVSLVNGLRRAASSNQKMLPHLLSRLKITDDSSVLQQFLRLRGFGLVSGLLFDFEQEIPIVKLVLEGLARLPLLNRNKIEDAKVEEPLARCKDSDDEEVSELAEHLMTQWSTLETAYRIPKRAPKQDGDTAETSFDFTFDSDIRPSKRSRTQQEDEFEAKFTIEQPSIINTASLTAAARASVVIPKAKATPVNTGPTKAEFDAILARAVEEAKKNAEAEEAAKVAKTTTTSKSSSSEKKPREKGKDREKGHRKHRHKDKDKGKERANGSSSKNAEQSKANKERRVLKLVGEVIVKSMSKYSKEMDHDTFKKHAKELTHLIAEKEKKSSSYETSEYKELSEEKKKKIKKFVHDYVAKVIKRIQKKKLASSTSSHGTPGQDQPSSATPNSAADPAESSREHTRLVSNGDSSMVMDEAAVDSMVLDMMGGPPDQDGDGDGDGDEDGDGDRTPGSDEDDEPDDEPGQDQTPQVDELANSASSDSLHRARELDDDIPMRDPEPAPQAVS